MAGSTRATDTVQRTSATGTGATPPWLIPLAAGVMLLAHALMMWLLRDSSLTPTEDSAIYVLLARSLRSLSYQNLYYVGEPAHRMYPPGYPALLAAASAVTGENIQVYLALSVLLQTTTLLLVFLAVRRYSPVLALGSLALLAVNPSLVIHGGRLYSEPLFALLTVTSLLLAAAAIRPAPATDAAEQTPAGHGGSAILAVAAVALAAGAALTRLIGVVLIIAIVLHFLFARRWLAAVSTAAVGAATAGAWIIWSVYLAESTVIRSYAFDAVVAIERAGGDALGPVRAALDSGQDYLASILPGVLGMPLVSGTRIDNAIAGLVLLAALTVGLLRLFARNRGAAFYMAGTAALLCIWAWKTDRFLFPVVPLLVPVILAGFAWLGARFGRAGRWALPVLFGLLILPSALGQIRTAFQRRDACRVEPERAPPGLCLWSAQPAWAFGRAVEYMRERVPAGTRLFNTFPASVYYHTGLVSIPYDEALAQPQGTLSEYLTRDDEAVRYVLVNDLHSLSRRVYRHLLSDCERFIVEKDFGGSMRIIRVRQPGEMPGPDDVGIACTALPPVQPRPGGEPDT